jgi:hypothetical protein
VNSNVNTEDALNESNGTEESKNGTNADVHDEDVFNESNGKEESKNETNADVHDADVKSTEVEVLVNKPNEEGDESQEEKTGETENRPFMPRRSLRLKEKRDKANLAEDKANMIRIQSYFEGLPDSPGDLENLVENRFASVQQGGTDLLKAINEEVAMMAKESDMDTNSVRKILVKEIKEYSDPKSALNDPIWGSEWRKAREKEYRLLRPVLSN